jgi:hypothetical protein
MMKSHFIWSNIILKGSDDGVLYLGFARFLDFVHHLMFLKSSAYTVSVFMT